MSNVPYLYVNIIALIAFFVMFVAFLAAKKTPEIVSFIIMLGVFILWVGGSVLMRLMVFPGVSFWFYVSIMALFATGLVIYLFACTFTQQKGYFLKIVWTVCTVIILILTPFGLFLQPPVATVLANGSTVFTYEMNWGILIPLIFLLCVILSIVKVFVTTVRTKGIRTPGLIPIILSCCIVALGNMIQIIPGNVFPWDTLSGIVFALLLMWSLYRKRMFRMTLLISRSVVLLASTALCVVAASFFIGPIKAFILDNFPLSDDSATTMLVLLFAAFLSLVYLTLRKLIDTLFTREEQQSQLLKNFSNTITQSLSTDEIMSKLVATLINEVPLEQVYVCLPEGDRFATKYSSNPLASVAFSIPKDSPCITQLKGPEAYFLLNEFKNTPMYRAVWDSEKALFARIDLSCMLALKDGNDIIALVLLSRRERSGSFSYLELSFLTTVASLAAVAIKNAGLYEQMYREARIDSLTNVYNYRCFVERIDTAFKASNGDSLALLYLDLDDFKLYNQLYGANAGDQALRQMAEVISRCVGPAGEVFRTSGKVFAAVLPGYDARRTEALAREISRRVAELSLTEEGGHRPMTLSCGICVSPYSASSVKELIENTDLAVFNAKSGGKNKIVVFRGTSPVSKRVSERALDIVERIESSKNSYYKDNSSTISALTAAIDAKDHYTYNHSRNVARYSAILATAAGLNEDQIGMIHEAALLHDIGKISIPENILSKTVSLDDSEFKVMKGHVNNSIDMIRHLPSMDYLIPAVVGHHERWDGKGYPRGIAGSEIPISARCLAIADAFDAMTTDRPYRKGLSVEYAADQIERGAGSQFDPQLARTFVDLIHSGEIQLLAQEHKLVCV